MNIYNNIVNPITGRKVNIDSKLGKNILSKFINAYQKGGAAGGDAIAPVDRVTYWQWLNSDGQWVSYNDRDQTRIRNVVQSNQEQSTPPGEVDVTCVNPITHIETGCTIDLGSYLQTDVEGHNTIIRQIDSRVVRIGSLMNSDEVKRSLPIIG